VQGKVLGGGGTPIVGIGAWADGRTGLQLGDQFTLLATQSEAAGAHSAAHEAFDEVRWMKTDYVIPIYNKLPGTGVNTIESYLTDIQSHVIWIPGEWVAKESTLLLVKDKTDPLPAFPADEITSQAIKAKTELLPADPASETSVSGVQSTANAIQAKTNALPAAPADETTSLAIMAKTNLLPGSPAATGDEMNLANGAIQASKFAPDAVAAAALATDAVNKIRDAHFAKNGLTAVGTVTYQQILAIQYAMARGRIVVSGSSFIFYDDDGITPRMTLTLSDLGRETA
jgi:hypothetical protein